MSALARCLGLALVAWSVIAQPLRAEIKITEVTSPGGITAWLYEEHSIPVIAIEASFQGGAALDPEGKEGAASLMAALLEEGAGDLDATQFAEARESLAARLGFSAGRDSVTVSARMLSETRDEVVELLRTALVEPRFDTEPIERVRAQMISALAEDETDPRTLAGRELYAQAFPDHVYARPTDGTSKSVAGLTADDLRAVHRNVLDRDRLQVAVVGDITEAELGPVLDQLFGDLAAPGVPLPEVAVPSLAGAQTVIDLPIPQSVVIFGHRGIDRDDPDFIPAFVLDHILGGGGFGSRLTEEVREKRGLTYGIYTYLAPDDYGALYLGQFSTANERAAEAIAIVRDEWARMADGGVTEEELEDAKRYLTGAYPLRFSGNARIASQLLGIQLADLGLDYVRERNDLVEAVTVEDIVRVAQRLLHPDELTFVVVGEPQGLEPTN